jgi:hypothetical protein
MQHTKLSLETGHQVDRAWQPVQSGGGRVDKQTGAKKDCPIVADERISKDGTVSY